MQTQEKLSELRNKMIIAGLDACIIPSGDPHLSEYPAEHWKIRQWLSGFTGSAGTLVITNNEGGLWTDSRYFLQADQQLDKESIQLFREGEPDVPEYTKWLKELLNPGSKVGVNGTMISVSQMRKLVRVLRDKGIQTDPNFSMAEEIWDTRPAIPDSTVFEHEDPWNGRSRSGKLEDIRRIMKEKEISHYISSTLDEIAWALNLRGTDVDFNPVFHAFLIVEHNQVRFFINPHKLTANIAKKLDADNIKVSLYEDFYQHVKEISGDSTIYIDPDKTNSTIFANLSSKATKHEDVGIITRLKARKNENEIKYFRSTLITDGVAMVHFLKWLEENVVTGKISEMSAAAKLKGFRKKLPNFMGESFAAISAYREHAAIAHYTVDKKSDKMLKTEGIYLIDSGGQYPGGTTDLTRTIALGEVPSQARIDYTLVLKGHISLACVSFPKGTRGVHLDSLARKAMWEHGINFGHGTGHGIGYFLNVHEGPQSIRPQDNGIEIEPGMITSNEPGVYRAGEYGIRIENLILCCHKESNAFGSFMNFETLTLCPIDTSLIEKELMTSDEINWLNHYHQRVVESLSPLLDEEHQKWLAYKCQKIEHQ